MTPKELEDRLIDFAVVIISIGEQTTDKLASAILIRQLIRSSSSSALNYAEARSAESKRDFQHKLQLVLKELRESYVNLRILAKCRLVSNENILQELNVECNELISIIVASVRTSKSN